MKSKLILFLIFFFSLPIIFLSVYIYFSSETILSNPFGLSDNYVQLRVFEGCPIDGYINSKKIIEGIQDILKNKEVILVYESLGALGIGIYDPSGRFGSELLKKGNMFSSTVSQEIVVRYGSYTHNYNVLRQGRNYVIDNRDGRKFTITGIYDLEHPLYGELINDYIYNFVSKNNIAGNYYFDSNSQDLSLVVYSILDLFRTNRHSAFIVSRGIGESTYINKLKRIVDGLLDRGFFATAITLFFFACINLIFFYYIILLNQKKNIEIYSIFGATKLNVFLKYSKKLIIHAFFGASLSMVVYRFLLSKSPHDLSFLLMATIIFISIIINYLIFTCVFYIGKVHKNPGW